MEESKPFHAKPSFSLFQSYILFKSMYEKKTVCLFFMYSIPVRASANKLNIVYLFIQKKDMVGSPSPPT